jgi:hypothetical protein
MAGVFQNIDPPSPSPPDDCVGLWCGGRTHSLGGEGGGGSIFWKTSDTALYSTYGSTLWNIVIEESHSFLSIVLFGSRYAIPDLS